MELSAIELRYLVNNINSVAASGYYVSNISGITKDSLLFRLHHTTKPEILLMISVKGVWITKLKFKTMEENALTSVFRTELERSRIESIEQLDGERILLFKFRHTNGDYRAVIVELFGDGNIIVCNQDLKIISILYNIEVRHRILKAGLRYVPPPSRGTDIFDLSIDKLRDLRKSAEGNNIDIWRWIGRNLSISKKFVEEIVIRSNISNKKPHSLSDEDINRLHAVITELVTDISTGRNVEPVVVIDDSEKPIDVIPLKTRAAMKLKIRNVQDYMEALDEVFSNALMDQGRSTRSGEIGKRIAILEHDLAEQNKAKDAVVFKANRIRKLASELMQLFQSGLDGDFDSASFKLLLTENSASIVNEKGSDYLEVLSERVLLESNIPKVASSLFIRAKEMERGSESIDEASANLLSHIGKLRKQTSSIAEGITAKKDTFKEWYERYRWFVTTDSLLAIGGRDSSSNSAIIRKHLTEKDIVFHAEVYGSPFFIIKNGNINEGTESIASSLHESAQATVSFSRAWKDGLSSADAYWVMPSQIKKGAPTGQFLPKGSFVIEGKRNYIKGLEIRLAIGIIRLGNRYALVCGPVDAVKKRSIVYAILLPGGVDPMNLAKKAKGELIKIAQTIEVSRYQDENSTEHSTSNSSDLTDFIKTISIDDFIRSLPSGKSKISFSGLGEEKLQRLSDGADKTDISVVNLIPPSSSSASFDEQSN
jgi:predicted ribosome quality control (RQC) complex YloA/Tae2 family protein